MNILNYALKYAAKGISIIPADRQTKRPLIEWKKYQTTRSTEEEIRNWWKQWPDANVGIVTGAVSGIVVVDVDSTDISVTKGLELPPTPTVRTSKGWHYYYKHPGGKVPNPTGLHEKIDIRADGGYVVAPPSVHASGHTYEWVMTDVAFASLPKWVTGNGKKFKDWSLGMPGAAQGERNATAAEIAGKLLRSFKEADWNLAWDNFVLWNQRNTPPLDEKELQSVFGSIKIREMKRREEKKDIPENEEEYRIVSTDELLEYLKTLPPPKVTKVPIPALENLMHGVEGGEVVVIGGLPGNGKTQLCTALTKKFEKGTCLWFSYEVTPRGLMARYNNAPPLFYIPIKHKTGDIQWLERRVEEALRKYPAIKHIFIDCIDDLFDETRWKNPALEIGVIMGRIKNIAVSKDLVVWMPAHVKKPDRATINTEPRLGDVAHSGAIEHKADFSIYIQRVPNEYTIGTQRQNMEYDGERDNKALIKVVKARRETAKVGKALMYLQNGDFIGMYEFPSTQNAPVVEEKDFEINTNIL